MSYDRIAEGIALQRAQLAFYQSLKLNQAMLGPEWPMERIDRELERHQLLMTRIQESGCDLA